MATAFAPRAPATMTARVVVMMTPDEKRALEARARAADMTPSEFCRRAVDRFDPQADDGVLEAFLTEFEANNRAMAAKLRATNDRLDATLAEIDARRAARDAELQAWRAECAGA